LRRLSKNFETVSFSARPIRASPEQVYDLPILPAERARAVLYSFSFAFRTRFLNAGCAKGTATTMSASVTDLEPLV